MRSVLAIAVSTSALAVLSLVSGPAGSSPRALAEPAPGASAPRPDPRRIDPARMVTDDCARARKAGKTCELTLAPEDVGGATPGPDDVALGILQFGHERSLIRFRRDFIVEIVRSAEDQ